MKTPDFRKALKAFIDHPFRVFVAAALLTAFFAAGLPELRVQSSIEDLVIEDLPETVAYRKFKQQFGTEEIILVKVKAENIFAPSTFNRLDLLSQELSRARGVRKVISLPMIKKDLDVGSKKDLADFERIIGGVALFRKNLVSDDRKSTVITLVLADSPDKREAVDAVREILDREKDGSPYQIGLPVVSQALARYTEQDFRTLPLVTFLIMGLVLIFTFRSLQGLLLPLGSLVLVLVWTFGLMAWTRTPLSMVTMIVPIFLIAVGTAYCLYLLSEHRHSAHGSGSPQEAAFQTFLKMGAPTCLAVLTTLIGLGSLLANRITAIREFALFACFGTLSVLAVILCLLPAVLGMLPLRLFGAAHGSRGGDLLGRFLEKLVDLHLRNRRTVLFMTALIALAAGLGTFRLKVETNPVEYFKENTPISRHFHDIYRDMAGSFPVNVVLDGKAADHFEDLQNLRKIVQAQGFLDTLPGVDKTISFADYVKLVNYARNQYKPEFYALPEEAFEFRMVMNDFKSLLGQDMFDRFMSGDLSKTNILLRTHISSSSEFLAVKEKILAHLKGDAYRGLQAEVTGFGTVIAQSSHVLTVGQIKSLSVTMVLIFAVITLLFRSAKVGVIAMMPNLFPIVLLFGLMGWLGFRLSVTTSLVASIAIGLSVDDTIHFLFRYHREFRKDPDRNGALRNTLRSVGRPIIMTTVTLCLGFAVLTVSNFRPTSEFGILMVITMATALLGGTMMLPSLMLRVELVGIWDLLKSVTTLDRLSDAIAHEFNQPLNAIKMGSEYLRMMVEKGDQIPPHSISAVAAEISEQADRASRIVTRLRELGRRVDVNPEKVDLNQAIREILAVMEHQFALQATELKVDLDDGLPAVVAHAGRVKQVFFNVLTNAWEALNEKDRSRAEAEPGVLGIRSFQEGDEVRVAVSDNGAGISSYEKDRVFEPFFTTREAGKGRGLGLTIAYGIVRDYGGKIRIQSEKGKGTTVEVSFPKPPY